MKLTALAQWARSGRLGLLRSMMRELGPYYRVAFLGSAVAGGLLRRLAAGPVPLERLAAELAPEPDAREGLVAWLDVGVSLGVLRRDARGYALRGRLARRLADPANDAFAAGIEEAGSLHHALIVETPQRLRTGRLFTLADQRGALVARSSRMIEPLVGEAVDAAVPRRGPLRLLEIGCGTGCHIRRAAARNPALTALGLELQAEVAAAARENLCAWGLGDRVTVEVGDVRERAPDPVFDLATLHNNIYYFPVAERVAVARHVRGLLRPGGRLLVTTGCAGGSPAMEVLSLWGAVTAGCGRLPAPEEMTAQLREAGFGAVTAWNVAPGDRFWAFLATAAPAR